MSAFFLKILNMSISASWLVLAVLLLRLVLKKSPKWIRVLLWGLVAIRLICPFSLESVFSLIPSNEPVNPQILLKTPGVSTVSPSMDSALSPTLQAPTVTVTPEKSVNTLPFLVLTFSKVWAVGVAAMLIYTAISYFLLRRRVATAVRLRDHIFQSENVISPFVLGIIKPRIYIPFQIEHQDIAYVIAHEMAHIRRKDHWWKPFGFALLALHWFNPLMWLGYVLLCRDIELACDEKVIKEMDSDAKANYTQALLSCSVNRRSIAACPLAFGEVGVKERVKSVMNYKKPAFWIIVATLITCGVVAVCFVTDPVSQTLQTIEDYQLRIPNEKTPVYVLEDNAYIFTGTIEKAQVQELYDLQISRKEVSQDRSEDRDKTHSLMLQTVHSDTPMTSSYLPGTYFHFNADFTQVWVDDDVKPTLSYQVTNPEQAREVYLRLTAKSNDPVATLEGNFRTYYANADGTWQYGGRNYQYRLEITGRMPNAKADTTFVYLSNLKNISFAQAWRAAGLSSNLEDYFSAEEAVLVEWITGDPDSNAADSSNHSVTKPESKLDAAISDAILSHRNSDKYYGSVNTESHIILVQETLSGTPLVGQTNHSREEILYVYYLNFRFHVRGDQPEEEEGIFGQAMITFHVDEQGQYTLKHFIKPEASVDSGAVYDEDLIKKFVSASEDIAANEEKYNKQLLDSCWETARDYVTNMKAASTAQPGGIHYELQMNSDTYDIDEDGKNEICTLSYNATSGLFSIRFFEASMDITTNTAKYTGTCILEGFSQLSFEITKDNQPKIKGVRTTAPEEAVYFDILLRDERIIIQPEEAERLLCPIEQH